ncbi:uncharacterized protein LOC113486553 isoform X2 [Athene cunicularia]|uniref:uncharacterized protein LOC113486553 isoform X2 n=1 Tax=Athene cunicularia TaxID=194338 RepID=UPI000EF69DE5|nr:uncharacterized protein LOC113486553 isoform X2 [Athene cunicularia]
MKTGSPLQGLQAGAVIHFPLQLGALFPVIYHLTTVFVCFPLGREPGGLVLGTPPPDALTTTAAVSSRRGRWPQASGTRHPSSLPAQPSPRDLLLLGEARSQQSQPSSQVLQEPCGTLWKRRKNHPECVGPTEEEFSARDLRPHCLACFPALSESGRDAAEEEAAHSKRWRVLKNLIVSKQKSWQRVRPAGGYFRARAEVIRTPSITYNLSALSCGSGRGGPSRAKDF